MKILVVGLGNPGMSGTRHNIGADVLSKMFNLDEKLSLVDDFMFLLCPSVMNVSGERVYKTYMYYKCEECIVVADDLDNEFGDVRYKNSCGSGGHNGIKSISKFINVFQQIRIGIGRPENKEQVSSFVLDYFTSDEKEKMPWVVDNCKKIWNNKIKKYF
jgi:PTH1 family peptidyl-tRNA hydrolase